MKCTKIILTLFIVLFSFSVDFVDVRALSLDRNLTAGDRKLILDNSGRVIANGVLDSFGRIVTNDYVLINGKVNLIFPYFADDVTALVNAKVNLKNVIEIIKSKFALEDLNSENCTIYKDSSIQYRREFGLDFSYQNDFSKLESFLSIYENSSRNNELKKVLNNSASRVDGTRTFSVSNMTQEIRDLLPYYAVENEMQNTTTVLENKSKGYSISSSNSAGNNLIQPMSTLGPTQLQRAITYASTYYQNYNPEYYNFNSDCTNFVSQILENAGIAMVDYYPDEHSGWWHHIEYILFFKIHKHSRSWAVADVFARYMGISNKRTITSNASFRSFTVDISTGDFITADWESDGIWDHMGFVTQKDSYEALYGSMTYFDFKVAQHSTNYHAWTSGSTNGWDNYSGRTYAIVRK